MGNSLLVQISKLQILLMLSSNWGRFVYLDGTYAAARIRKYGVFFDWLRTYMNFFQI